MTQAPPSPTKSLDDGSHPSLKLAPNKSKGPDFSLQGSVEEFLLKDDWENENSCMPLEILEELREMDGNDVCIDCGELDPVWASINLGVFMCLDCSGKHRALGTHVSKVRSVKMDSWSDEQIEIMRLGGNMQCVKFLKKHGIRGKHSVKQRYDSPACKLYAQVLQARRKGLPEPTELPKEEKTIDRETLKKRMAGLGSTHHASNRGREPKRGGLSQSQSFNLSGFFRSDFSTSPGPHSRRRNVDASPGPLSRMASSGALRGLSPGTLSRNKEKARSRGVGHGNGHGNATSTNADDRMDESRNQRGRAEPVNRGIGQANSFGFFHRR